MKYVKILPSGLAASALCLGAASFGSAVAKEDAFAQMDRFFDAGGNIIDTARVYADWVPGGRGVSERTVGEWIKERKNRNKVLVSTKGAHPDLKTMNVPRMSAGELRRDLEESLEALKTDYIDLYFLHRDDVSRSVEEILQNLEILRKEGKINHYGCSNWTLSRLKEACETASRCGFFGFVCNQIRFSLGDINENGIGDKTTVPMDKEFFTWHEKTGKAVMAYTSSCNGYFSKKLKGTPVSEETEKAYNNASNQKLLEKLSQWEKGYGVPTGALVLSYVMAQDFPSVSISSFSSPEQLAEALLAADFNFPAEVLSEIRDIKIFLGA